MLKYNFKFAIRSIIRNKLISSINIIGLSISLAACFIIYLYVFYETGYDRFHKDYKKIFRINAKRKIYDEIDPRTSYNLALELKSEFPEIENITRIRVLPASYVKKGNEFFEEKYIKCADKGIFDMLSLPFLKGNSKTALNDPNSVVLTQRMSVKYFNDDNPIGNVLTVKCKDTILYLNVTSTHKDF